MLTGLHNKIIISSPTILITDWADPNLNLFVYVKFQPIGNNCHIFTVFAGLPPFWSKNIDGLIFNRCSIDFHPFGKFSFDLCCFHPSGRLLNAKHLFAFSLAPSDYSV